MLIAKIEGEIILLAKVEDLSSLDTHMGRKDQNSMI